MIRDVLSVKDGYGLGDDEERTLVDKCKIS